jgi:hypothetical protein
VVGRLYDNEGISCGEVFSHTQDYIMNHNTPSEVEPSESCVCKDVFIRHLLVCLSEFIVDTNQMTIRNMEKRQFNVRILGKPLLLPD